MAKNFEALNSIATLADGDRFVADDVSESETREVFASVIATYMASVLATTMSDVSITGTLAATGNVDFDGTADIASTLDVGAGTTRRVAPAGTFVNNAEGNPTINSTSFVVTSDIAESTWESVGPTGSGEDNIWTALNDVPDDADYIDIKMYCNCYSIGDAANTLRNTLLYARDVGSAEGPGAENLIAWRAQLTNGSGNSYNGFVARARIPVSSQAFEFYWIDDHTEHYILLHLIGWGFNP